MLYEPIEGCEKSPASQGQTDGKGSRGLTMTCDARRREHSRWMGGGVRRMPTQLPEATWDALTFCVHSHVPVLCATLYARFSHVLTSLCGMRDSKTSHAESSRDTERIRE